MCYCPTLILCHITKTCFDKDTGDQNFSLMDVNSTGVGVCVSLCVCVYISTGLFNRFPPPQVFLQTLDGMKKGIGNST